MGQTVEATVETTSRREPRSRKVRAILAGGLVLGVGAAITLAAWNDSEFARGTFTAGTFNMVGSIDGTMYAEHATVGAPAALTFVVNPTLLAPGDIVYAPLAVRLDAATTNDALVTISNAATSGVVTNLTYTLIQPATFGCTLATTGTTLVAAGTAVAVVPGTPTFSLLKGVTALPGVPAYLCFKVTAGASIAQAQTGTATWQFAAVSQ